LELVFDKLIQVLRSCSRHRIERVCDWTLIPSRIGPVWWHLLLWKEA